jgi:prepilin-type N-terminal cleavage/methylation domain-containing protein
MKLLKKITLNSKAEYKRGFTVIELMISTIIFSLILLAASAAIVEVGKKYYRGITNSRTQAVARSVTEEIAQSLQYTGQSVRVPNYPGGVTTYGPEINTGDPDTFYFCIGAKRYTFAIDRVLKSNNPAPNTKEKQHVLWVDEPETGCAFAPTMVPANLDQENPSNQASATDPIATNGRELLNEDMRIYKMNIEPKSNGLWTINVTIASGEDDLLVQNSSGDMVCEGSTFGTEFCSVSEISLNVSKRIQ